MTNHEINEAANFYGKEIMKVASRMAYDYSRKRGLSLDLRYLFEAVDRLGQKNSTRLTK